MNEYRVLTEFIETFVHVVNANSKGEAKEIARSLSLKDKGTAVDYYWHNSLVALPSEFEETKNWPGKQF